MITRFSVENFKSFEKKLVLDLENSKKYEFNSDSVVNGVIQNAIIYGPNGAGKSNLGLAIFDIIHHLTDFSNNGSFYVNYLNAKSDEPRAIFKYRFKFGEDIVEYKYEKSNSTSILVEKLIINNRTVANIDRYKSSTATILLHGAESLNNQLTNLNLSLLKYIKNNSQLKSTNENEVFYKFYSFVESMLFFRSVDSNMFIGLESGNTNIQNDIIEKGVTKDLEAFLNKGGIECKLTVDNFETKKIIYFDFDSEKIPFYEIASTGTKSLVLFFSWLQRVKQNGKVKFLFIDEFDAFYHHNLSAMIVEELKNTNVQFLLTTHNTSIVSNDILRPDCYFRLNNNVISSFASKTSKELREAHNIEKMYKAGTFNG